MTGNVSTVYKALDHKYPGYYLYDGTLVFNCMGGEPDQKVACANAATYAYFPPLRDAVLADAFLHA